jgi:uncharacterized protein DUF6941
MQLDFAILAKYAELAADGTFTTVGGGFSAIGTTGLPLTIPNLFLLVRLDTSPDEAGKPFELTIDVIRPNGTPVPGMQGKLGFTPVPNTVDQTKPSQFLGLVHVMGLTVQEAGVHWVRITRSDNQQDLGRLMLLVQVQGQ